MLTLPPPLGPLAAFRQFIVYKLVPKVDRPGKVDKIPVHHVTGNKVDAHDPAAWTDVQTAIAAAQAWNMNVVAPCTGYGVGFVFTDADPFFFIDVDGCIKDNQWSPIALQLLQVFNGAAVEVSQSGTGIHIIGCGNIAEHGCKNTPLGLEFYTSGRFVALTGNHAWGSASQDCTQLLPWLVQNYFPAREATKGAEWTTAAVPDWSGPEDDGELITRALSAKSAASVFGGKASFADLFYANAEVLGHAYPDNFNNPPRPFDASSADAALAQHLAFWTGNNCERIARIMWQSALRRAKWEEHKTYLYMTITRAVGSQSKVYQQGRVREVQAAQGATQPLIPMDGPAAPPHTTMSAMDGPQYAQGLQFMAATQQAEFFKGCVYIQDLHRVFVPSGALLRSEQFNATYGGYLFAMDGANEKTTRKAWEAFTESQCIRWPKAEGACFRPDLEPGKLVEHEGRTLANIYVPVPTRRARGDASKFLQHLRRILPVERDQIILLSYMAACVQHKGVKFQWAPLLQGCPGNGKTLFTRCVAFAIGYRYTHLPRAEDINNRFNAWMLNKIFIGIEDVYVPDNKLEVIEALKPMITNDRLEIQLKGVDQVTAPVCANFMLNSNHKDAIRKNEDDRRFCIFYTAQQSHADIVRDGMTGDYFPDLYEWLRGDGRYVGQAPGYAVVNELLATYPIPAEFNPAAACHRAPRTSSTDEVLSLSRGSVEQEIAEAIDEGRPGFAGGWVSSMALDRLLESLRMSRAIPVNRRREILQGMGFDWHPALNNGRVNNPVPLDGGKPRLFIKAQHPALAITDPAEIARQYVNAQLSAGVPR